MTAGVPGGPGGVTPAWLTEVLRSDGAIGDASAVVASRSTSIGTGQVGDNVRFELDYEGPAGPASVVCKFGSSDPASAAAGVSMHLYETEVAFYTELAATVDVARPHCYFAAVTPGTADAALVMEDLAPAVPGDQITGCSVAEAERAVDEAARLHGPRWGDPSLAEMAWLAREGEGGGLEMMMPFVWDSYVERYQSAVLPVTREAAKAMADLGPLMAGRPGTPRCPTHYDFRLDNMLF
ncbi:MAG: phosphotransferase family protein, partial [Acidimicrobiales bacterium]